VFIDDGAVATLDHELILHNACPDGGTTGGVGIYVDGYDTIGSTVTIDHTTVAGNDCPTRAATACTSRGTRGHVSNTIFWATAVTTSPSIARRRSTPRTSRRRSPSKARGT